MVGTYDKTDGGDSTHHSFDWGDINILCVWDWGVGGIIHIVQITGINEITQNYFYTEHNSIFFSLNICSCYIKIKLYAENQPPSLLKYGDRYEEDIKSKFRR